MKSLFRYSYLFIIGISVVLTAASCTDDCEREASPVVTEGGYIISGQSSYSYVPEDEQSFNITVARADGAGTATVHLSGDNDDFTVPSEVTFAEGETSKDVKITFDIAVGSSAEVTIRCEEEYVYGITSQTISVNRDYTWESAGKVSMTSGWAGKTAEVPVERAKEYSGEGFLYRLNSPYYVLEPNACPQAGYHIQFTLDNEYNALSLPVQFQEIGEAEDGYGNFYLGWFDTGEYDCSFTNVGNVFTINGVWAYDENGSSLTLYAYATEEFTWIEQYPGTVK